MRPGSFWELLSATDRQALRAMGRRTDIPPGGMLLHQGVAAAAVYVVFKAGARTTGNIVAKEFVDSGDGDESVIDLFGSGDVVGALAPWGHPQRGSVAALDHVTALRVDRGAFAGLLAANPRVTEAMMHAIARGAAFEGRRQAVRGAGHPQRLAYHLLELAHRFGERTARGIEVPARLSQAELANWAGISRETLVRCFRRWRAKGVLGGRSRPLVILDAEALRRAAGAWGDEWPDPSPDGAAGAAGEAVPSAAGGGSAPGAASEGRAPGAVIAVRAPVPLERPAAGAPASRLPADNPYFTGRAVSLGKLDLLVSQAETPRAVVIQGMAGVGKTTLALHWAHRVADRFPDGVVFTDLRGTTRAPVTAAEAMGQVLRGLGVPGDRLSRGESELAAQCRSLLAGRRVLLILDDAAGPEQIRPLLAAMDAGLAVVTTQRRLPVLLEGADIRTLELREMTPDEALDLFAAVLGPGDRRVRDARDAALRLARECGFLPLALGIMAGRLADNPGEPIDVTLRQLADPDGAASGGYGGLRPPGVHGGGVPQRLNGVLSPTFEVAYRGLRRDQRAAFRRLGLLVGPDFTPRVLAALLDRPEDEARECLEGLRQAYLVHDVAPGRYRMHDLLRDFARERGLIEDADSDRLAAQRRMLARYLADARNAGRALRRHRRPTLDAHEDTAADAPGANDATSAAERTTSLAWFEAERRNLVAAVEQAARLGLHRTCWELADALFDFQNFRRYTEDTIAVQQAGLHAARTEEDWAAAAVMLHNLAVAHAVVGRSVQAIGYAEDARRGFRSLDPPNRFGEAAALAVLADVHTTLGRYPTAIEHARRALGIHRELGDRGGVADAEEILARAHLGLAADDAALEHADRALRIRRRIGDMPGVAEALLTLARVHRRKGAVHAAVSRALEALSIRQEQADRFGAAQALTELARMYNALGLRDLALRDGRKALDTYRALGVRHGEARALATLGMLMCDAARFAEAFSYCGEALRLHRGVGDRHGEAEALAQIGIVCGRLGRYPEAREQLLRALEIRREIGDLHGEAHDLEHLSLVLRRLDRHQEAFVFGLEALDLWHRLGARGGLATTLGSLARTYLQLGLHEQAERAARQALEIRREIDDRYGMGVGLDTYAMVLLRSGRAGEALEVEREALRVLGDVGDRHSEGTALVNLASIYLELDRAAEALEAGRRAFDTAAELGDTRGQAHSLHTMGRACQRLRRHARAVAHFDAEIAIRREMGDLRGQRAALDRRRASHLALGDHAAAADCARRVQAIDQWLRSDRADDQDPAPGN